MTAAVLAVTGPAEAEYIDEPTVEAFGSASDLGSPAGTELSVPLVGMAPTPTGNGYWLAGNDGSVTAVGDAQDHGSMAGIPLNQQIVGIAATPTGNGYWMVATDGGIFSFGDAQFHGSMGGVRLNEPIVGIAATPTGDGYWMVASDGGIFSFGDAQFHGSMGGTRLNRPVVGMAAAPTGNGYWMVATDGGIFSFGDAQFRGSMGGTLLHRSIVGMDATPTGNGYWMVGSDGGIFSFGNAGYHGSGAATPTNQPVVGMAAVPSGGGYWLVSQGLCYMDGDYGVRESRPETNVMLLTDVNTGDFACWEQVVFDFENAGGAPDGAISYRVEYASPPFIGTPGVPIPVAGQRFLRVTFFGARTADIDSVPIRETYTGPDEIVPADLEWVQEIQLVEDFEAQMVWVIGLDTGRDFRLQQLDAPDRLVIDIGPP